MTLSDVRGRPYARREAVKPGDILVADGGFTCMAEGERKVVCTDKGGHGFQRLYVSCKCDANNAPTRPGEEPWQQIMRNLLAHKHERFMSVPGGIRLQRRREQPASAPQDRHYLYGQDEGDGELIGLYLADT